MLAICGLGNPGRRYLNTRHNVGYKFIDQILLKHKFTILNKNKSIEIYKGKVKNHRLVLLRPLTFMNLSGTIIGKFLNFYKISKKNLIVIHDDLDLKTGKVKIKTGGGNAGHNGLNSIDNVIGNSYKRLRIGIGHPGNKTLVNRHVLSKFKLNEKKIIDKVIALSVEHIDNLLTNRELFLTKINYLIHK